MNKILEKAKDFFYDATDYILILVIVASVSGIIVWRLDLLFDKNSDGSLVNSDVTVSENDKSSSNKKDELSSDKTDSDLIEKEKDSKKGIVNISIPEGSLPPTIANILLENGLISDKYEFLKKSQDMGLDTKLRSGEYEINKNSSLEDIVKIIARQK